MMMTRREFFAPPAASARWPLRLGFVGVGGRGSYHLDVCLSLGGQVKAICDINPDYLYRAKRYVEEAGQPSPALYDRGPLDWKRLCDRADLDVVITATPWQWHTPICLAAMNAGKHCATEVPAALTVEDCWALVETSEKTGRHAMMLEQDNYVRDILLLLQMVRQGVFGEVRQATGGYVHDLRVVKSDPEREPWRMQFEFEHNGNLYPTHRIGPISWLLDIHHGYRIESLMSLSSKPGCVKEFTRRYYGESHPYLSQTFTQGDCNTTLLTTAKGKSITLYYDTNTPHPHTTEFRIEGSQGVYVGDLKRVFTGSHGEGEPLSQLRRYEHPLWQYVDRRNYKEGRGHGIGFDTPLMWERYFTAIVNGQEPDMSIADGAAWSAIIPLSEQSVAAKGGPIDFPDFTRGRWKESAPVALAVEPPLG